MMGMRLQGPGTISVLDIATGELLYSRGTTGYPRPQFSPDSRLLMTDSRNDPVLDARTGAIVFRPPNDFGFFTEFSGSSRYLASEGEAGSLHVADLGNGKTLVIPAAAVSGGYAVTRLGWLFSCAGEDLLKVWDAASGRAGALGSTLQFRPAAIVPLADGVSAMIVAYPRRPSGPACELQFWRLQSPRKCAQVGARRRTYDAVFSPDGKKLALMTCGALSETCHYDTCDRLDVLDLHQGTGVRSSIVQHDGIQFARWCAEGQRLVVVSDTGRTSVYEASTGEFVPVPGLGDHKAEYAEVDSTGRWLMIAGEGSFSVWDLNDGLCKVSPEACGRRIRAATLSRDGRSVVLTCSSAVFVYEAEKGRLLVEDRRGRRCYPDAVLSQNGSRIVVYASTSDTDTVHTWDANTGKLLGSKPVRRVRTVCLSPDGRRLATMTFDDSLQIWAADFSSLILGPVKASGQWIALFTRSGRLLLQARGDGTVAAWDARTGLPCGQPIPCAGQTPKFVRHRRDEWLFVSRDSSVYLVDIRTGLALAGPFSADGKVDWLRYTPGGDWLAVAGTNGSVRLYDVSICNRSPDHRLPDLAEAIVGMRMGPLGGPEEAPHASDTRTSLRAFYGMKKDPYSRWAFSLLGGEPDPVQPHR
jgi:WD40 repeat protein